MYIYRIVNIECYICTYITFSYDFFTNQNNFLFIKFFSCSDRFCMFRINWINSISMMKGLNDYDSLIKKNLGVFLIFFSQFFHFVLDFLFKYKIFELFF